MVFQQCGLFRAKLCWLHYFSGTKSTSEVRFINAFNTLVYTYFFNRIRSNSICYACNSSWWLHSKLSAWTIWQLLHYLECAVKSSVLPIELSDQIWQRYDTGFWKLKSVQTQIESHESKADKDILLTRMILTLFVYPWIDVLSQQMLWLRFCLLFSNCCLFFVLTLFILRFIVFHQYNMQHT